MLSRRLIRIKVFKILFSKIITNDKSYISADSELIESCNKTVSLYCFLLALPIELKKMAQMKVESGLKKFHPKPEELNPNRKFIQNKYIEILENDPAFVKLLSKMGLNWAPYQDFVKELYNTFTAKDYFKEYMENPSCSVEEDVKLIKRFYEEELDDNDEMYDLLEETSVYWMDDLGYVINYILNSIDNIVKTKVVSKPETFMKADDKLFAETLLKESMVNYDEYSDTVSQFISNWDLDRLVNTDLVLVVMGIAEAVAFESIPIKVTINEYVDISKYYSTPNSKVFINGLLDKIIQQMLKDNKIIKSGRGLVGGDTKPKSGRNDRDEVAEEVKTQRKLKPRFIRGGKSSVNTSSAKDDNTNN